MTRLSTKFSAGLNTVWNFIKCHPCLTLILLLLVGLALITICTKNLILLLSTVLLTLLFFTIRVAQLTQEATKDERDARAKVGRLWLEFFFVVAFGLVVTIIQYDQQEHIDTRQSIQQTHIDFRQSKLQEEIAARSDYFNAISQLGSLSPAVRMSGIDYLNETCMGRRKKPHPDKCNKDDTIKLLIDQVKFFTQSKSYQEDFAEEPSGDIAEIIKILRRVQKPANIMWDGAYLRGVNLSGADLQGAYLYRADLQGADLEKANLQGANLWEANLQEADLRNAHLQRAWLSGTNLQGANLWEANLQEADLREAKLQGADLQWAKLQGANLDEANLQGANLYRAELQEADLDMANLQGAYSKYERLSVNFCTRINSRIGKCAEIEGKGVLFSGGITEELWEEMEKTQWHNEEVKEDFLSKMKSHLINKDPVYTIPDEFKNEVNIGRLTKKTATAIIKEYNENLTGEQARCELPQ